MKTLQFLNNPIKSFNVEATTRCFIQCSGCDRTIRKGKVPGNRDLTLSFFEKLINEDLKDVDLTGVKWNFCGIYGDNAYNPEILDILKLVKSRKSSVVFETNGSYTDSDFWNKIIEVLDSSDWITFSIDGLEDTNHVYRKNSRWADIENALTIVGNSSVLSRWKWIVFSHNEHQIEEAKEFAKIKNIDEFIVRKSPRFNHKGEDGLRPSSAYIGLGQTRWEQVYASKKSNSLNTDISILPKCLSGRNIGITYEGLLIPCLTFHSVKNEWMLNNSYKFDLNARNIFDVLEDDIWTELKNQWNTPSSAPFICNKYCGMRKTEAVNYDKNLTKYEDIERFDIKNNE